MWCQDQTMQSKRLILAIGGAVSLAVAGTVAIAEPPQGNIDRQILHLHNQARADRQLPGLQWNADLAKAARGWARTLAAEGRLRHSGWKERNGTGENLWIGTRGYYGPASMIGAFINEKQDFHPGIFPKVSRTGRWEDVGHYTQIIWPDTQQVGCALARSGGVDVLVCRYWPAGNYIGSKVG